jgi:hypothetical protein
LNILDVSRFYGHLSLDDMSDEATAHPEDSSNPTAENPPRVRRISTPRPKKVAKKSGAVKSAAMEMVEEKESPIPFPSAPIRKEPLGVPEAAGNDWPENETESSGGALSQTTDSTKRKRRRRKGKGQGNPLPIAGEPLTDENRPVAEPETKSSDSAHDQRPRSPQGGQHQPSPRSKIDPELLTKMAWKIYLAEVSEEGVALIGDNDAKDLSRRCYRLAEIFIEEQLRRR